MNRHCVARTITLALAILAVAACQRGDVDRGKEAAKESGKQTASEPAKEPEREASKEALKEATKETMKGAATYDATAMRAALERIEAWHAAYRTPIARAFRPGLGDTELTRKLQSLPCRLPREIQALYTWHDGTEIVDDEFVWYHYLPSLDRAIGNYRRLVASGLLHPDEFPVLDFEGEYYVVRCSAGTSDTSPVWLVFHNPARPVNYVSFTAFMQTAADWYESGAASGVDRATDAADLPRRRENLLRLRDIHQRYNPGAMFPYAVR